MVVKKEKSLHHGEGWCQTHGNVLQGLRGDVGRSGSRLGAAHRHQNSRSDDTFVSHLPASESQIVACLLTLKLSFSLCFFSLLVGIEPCRFKLVSYVSIAGIM